MILIFKCIHVCVDKCGCKIVKGSQERKKTIAAVSEKPLREMRRESTFERTKLSNTAATSAFSQFGRHLSVCNNIEEEDREEERERREKLRRREDGGKCD